MSPSTTFADRVHPDTICLFDVDGPLTPARLVHQFHPVSLFFRPLILSLNAKLKLFFFVHSNCLCSISPRRWRRHLPSFARSVSSALLVDLTWPSKLSNWDPTVCAYSVSLCVCVLCDLPIKDERCCSNHSTPHNVRIAILTWRTY